MSKRKSLLDAYQFAGFRPKATIKGILGDPKAQIIRLARRQKNGVPLALADDFRTFRVSHLIADITQFLAA